VENGPSSVFKKMAVCRDHGPRSCLKNGVRGGGLAMWLFPDPAGRLMAFRLGKTHESPGARTTKKSPNGQQALIGIRNVDGAVSFSVQICWKNR